jgi:hypothetical protein
LAEVEASLKRELPTPLAEPPGTEPRALNFNFYALSWVMLIAAHQRLFQDGEVEVFQRADALMIKFNMMSVP